MGCRISFLCRIGLVSSGRCAECRTALAQLVAQLEATAPTPEVAECTCDHATFERPGPFEECPQHGSQVPRYPGTRWYVGEQNDILYIIDRKPRPASRDAISDIPGVKVMATISADAGAEVPGLLAAAPEMADFIRDFVPARECVGTKTAYGGTGYCNCAWHRH